MEKPKGLTYYCCANDVSVYWTGCYTQSGKNKVEFKTKEEALVYVAACLEIYLSWDKTPEHIRKLR